MCIPTIKETKKCLKYQLKGRLAIVLCHSSKQQSSGWVCDIIKRNSWAH